VSRKAVLNLARDLEFGKIKGMENYKHRCIEIEDVEELSSVMPDLSSLREINEALTKRVQFLETMNKYATPITPTRKKGHWEQYGDFWKEKYRCSECKEEQPKILCGEQIIGYWSDYCPHCGAEMQEVEQEVEHE
jgi:hypothetical protein